MAYLYIIQTTGSKLTLDDSRNITPPCLTNIPRLKGLRVTQKTGILKESIYITLQKTRNCRVRKTYYKRTGKKKDNNLFTDSKKKKNRTEHVETFLFFCQNIPKSCFLE